MATIRREIIRSQPQMPVAQAVPTSLPSYEGGEEKNKGGLIGGVGYLGEKVAVGTVQSIEGIFDYTLGGVAKLFGFDKFAERQFANDWFGDWYDHPDEWFNPGKGWQVAGDIAGGIGTSLPTLAVGLATGGAGLAMFGVAGLSAAGNATKEAYRETGKLGGREFTYGALTGALEGGIETLTNLVGMGTGAVIKSFGKSIGKEFTESALRQGVGITLAKAFGGEAIEEGVAEIMSSRFKRWTYDSDAEHASMGQILYASFVGGMSGVIMGGAGTVFSTAQNISRGTQLVEAGQADAVIEHAKYISEKAKKGGIEVGAMKQVEATYNKLVKSLEKTGGEVKTVAQRQMLGELKIDNIAAELSPPMYKTVAAIANDPDTFVEKLNAYGYTDANGNVRTVTKEQLMKGLDVNNLKGTIPTALETNEILRDIVLMSMAGEMMINTSKFQESILRGEKFAGDADLENFLRVASPEEVKSVEKLFGIKDLRTVDAETFNERVAAFEASGQYDEYLASYKAEKTASTEAINTENNANIEENTANPVEESTVDNERHALPEEEESTSASSTGEETKQNTSASRDGDVVMTLVDSMKFAKENVPEYKSLNADDQAKIRRLIRQAKANGFTDAQTRAYARVSARSGIDIVIGKEGLLIGKTETGADKYADGVYSPSRNKILVNPEGSRSPARLLVHELTHAIYKDSKGRLWLDEGTANLSKQEQAKIIAKYFPDGKIDVEEYFDEVNAHYTEALLDDDTLLQKLCDEHPTLEDKIVNFLTGAKRDYADTPVLSREAKKLYKRYKDLFDSFAERNQYADVKKQGGERYSYSSIAYSFFGDSNVSIEDFENGSYKNTKGYKKYVDECISNMSQVATSNGEAFNENSARKEVEASIKGIVDVAVAMKKAGYDILDDAKTRGAIDSKNRLLFSSLEPNSDYFTSSDISTICDKRINFAEIYDEIVRREEAMNVPADKRFFANIDNYFAIHDIMARKGLTQPCRQCYVESMRKNLAPMAKAFIKLMQETDPNNKANDQLYQQKGKNKGELKSNNAKLREKLLSAIEENRYEITADKLTIKTLTTSDGLAKLKIQAPLIYEAFNSFYGQSKPKMPKAATPFRFGELTALLTDDDGKIKTNLVKQIVSTGGFRLQSYSDFQIQNFVDVLQVIFEAGTLGLNGHAYTKVPAFLDATKGTNLKRNISIFMYQDGKQWKIDHKDSFPLKLDEIYDIVKADKQGNTSIIAVTQNEVMAAYVMANDNIGYFIPFHKSGLKMGTVRDTDVYADGKKIKGYSNIKDHTRQQTEVWAKTTSDHKAYTKVKKGINIYEFWDFDNTEGLSKKELIEKNVKRYIDECEKAGYIPKFREYVMNNGKVLDNVLAYSKKLGFASADATIDDISFEHKGYRIPYGYYKCLGDFGMFKPNGKASPIERLSLKDYDFASAVEFFSNAERLRRNEILQQIDNGVEREKYISGEYKDMTTADIAKVINKKRTEVVEEVMNKTNRQHGDRMALPDTAYLDAVNRGDMETAQRMVDEAAKEAGYDSPKLYHGTKMFGFTKVKTSGVEKGVAWSPFFAANKEDISASYVPYGKVRDISSNMDEEAIEEARETAIEERKENISDLVYDFRHLIDKYFSPWVFGQTDNSYLESLVEKANPEAGYGDGVYDVLSEIVYYNFYDYQEEFSEYEDADDWADNSPEGKEIFSKILEIEGEKAALHRLEMGEELGGIYQLYANLDNMYIVDGKGVAWNELRPEGLPSLERYGVKDVAYKTRDVAEWARDNGFDGVIFKNIRDNGAYGRTPSGDVYVFFRPESQVKSADPVTYDDKGNVIPLSQRFNSKNDDIRYALPDEEVNELDMSEAVAKKRKAYDESLKQKLITTKDSIYIDTVDEYYGAEKYLSKFGKKKNAASILQAIRASMSAAQVMIGDVQKDIFSEDGKTLGEGLSKIVKPITVKGETIKRTFNEYLMHHLNVDRMSLEEKSLAQLEEMKAKLEGDVQKVRKLNEKIADLKDKKKSIFSDEEAQKQIDQRIAKYQREAEALKADILEQKKQIDNFEIMKNKPVFGENEARAEAITAEQSLKRIAELEKVHPDFRETAEKVWAYTKNLNHMRVEAGLISAESEAYMNELYPHYVPAYRDTNGGGAAAIKGRRNLAISSTVKSAKGSGLDILDVMDSIAAQTQEVIRAGRINQLFRAIYDTAMLGNGTEYVEIVSRQKVSGKQVADESAEGEMPNTIELRPKNNQVTGFVNGEKVTLSVSDEIFIAFDSMSKPTVDPTSAIGKGMQKLNDIYKRLITSWSPAFLLRNPIRDIQDAGLNSKHPIEFARNLVKVYKMMLENSEEWQTYRAYGGYSASIFGQDGFSADVDSRGFEAMAKLFDTDAPTMKDFFEAAKRGGKNLLTGINNVNAFVEQATRFAEYLASVEAGDSIPDAINNAAEVTTNFGRRGRITKVLNATIMPFLNPAVQGFDKMFRNVGDAFKEGSGAAIAKALGVLFAKAAAIGLAPMVINMLMYGDDEDYEQLREEDKENNFLIKVGDSFIKIPRGRVASVIGGTANRASKLAKGEDADLKGYAENVLSQVTPVGNLTRTIFSPFFDVKNNRTWYGTEIEGRQWDNTAPKDRYDESTSSIAIGIGKVTNYSPKKIHYLLDQYSGVVGDFVLPATSEKATKDFFSGNFTIDAATSNKLSSQFYEMYDRAQYAKTAGDDTAIYQVKYLNSVKDAVSKLHDEKQAIQNDSKLSNVEKLQKSRVVQILINEAYKTALADIERYTQAFEATAGIEKTATFQSAFGTSATDATIQKMRYTEATRYMYGAKKALEEYDDKVYEKCELLNSAGVDYDNLYYYYFSTKGLTSDVDKKGNTVSGSKRKKVVATINALDIPSVQKALLICAQGYTLQSGDVKGVTEKKLLSYILKLNTSKQVKENLAKLCGFEVKNGKISIK